MTPLLSFGKSVEDILKMMERGDIRNSIESLFDLSRQNDLIAQFYVGECYNYGLGVMKNDSKAFEMYRKAAERGLPEAMLMLSFFYKNGRHVSQDLKKAQEWEFKYKKRGGKVLLLDIRNQYEIGLNNQENLNEHDCNVNYNKIQSSARYYNTTAYAVRDDILHKSEYIDSLNLSMDMENISSSSQISNNTYAIVIANENYKRVPNVSYALNDGDIFRKYLILYFGILEGNIQYLEDASLNDIKYALANVAQRCNAFKDQVSVIVYYAGHGVPDDKTSEAFLLPVDGFGTDPSSGLNLDDFYTSLSAMHAKSVVVLLDACFSGAKRDGGMLMATRGITIKPKMQVPDGKLIVLSATSNDETAFPIEQQKHGLFTYTLLRKIQETGGDITWGELADHVTETVKNRSIDLNGKLQTPTVSVSQSMKDIWKNIKLR